MKLAFGFLEATLRKKMENDRMPGQEIIDRREGRRRCGRDNLASLSCAANSVSHGKSVTSLPLPWKHS